MLREEPTGGPPALVPCEPSQQGADLLAKLALNSRAGKGAALSPWVQVVPLGGTRTSSTSQVRKGSCAYSQGLASLGQQVPALPLALVASWALWEHPSGWTGFWPSHLCPLPPHWFDHTPAFPRGRPRASI